MEVTSCQHREKVETTDGVEVGICTECHQALQYGDGKYPTVTKLGRIGDKLVLPNVLYKLLLDPRDRQDLSIAMGRTPRDGVPPKPETKSVAMLHQYYEENRDAILHDLDTLGEKAMRKRWDMSQATFFGLLARPDWRPDYPGIPRWGREKGKRVKTAKKAPGGKRRKPAAVTPRPIVELVLNNPSQHLTITDRDIALLIDDDFERFWSLLGQIVKRRAKVVTP